MINGPDTSFPELQFPVVCHFKVIGEQGRNLQAKLEHALCSIGIEESMEQGRSSKGGRYVTYNLSVMVRDRDSMIHIDRTLRGVEGVKMVL